jgi:hypothetical protein
MLGTISQAGPVLHPPTAVKRQLNFDLDALEGLLKAPARHSAGQWVPLLPLEPNSEVEEFKVAFGTHDRIKVQRVLVERNRERVGRNKARYTFHFRTTLHNYGDKAQTVELVDQIPVAQTDRINVKLLKATPGHTTKESDPAGLLTWRVKLAPGAEKTIKLSFTVTTPREAVPYEVQKLMQ